MGRRREVEYIEYMAPRNAVAWTRRDYCEKTAETPQQEQEDGGILARIEAHAAARAYDYWNARRIAWQQSVRRRTI